MIININYIKKQIIMHFQTQTNMLSKQTDNQDTNIPCD